jgi:hypothetical protein
MTPGFALAMAAAVATAAAIPATEGWHRMVAMVAALFLAFKAVSLPQRRALPYLLLWPGTDPRPFESTRRPDPTAARLLGQGTAFAAAGLFAIAVLGASHPYLAMLGAILAVHLGLFDVLAAAWRWYGLDVGRICPDPWRSRSLAEFWGARWNLAFHVVARDRIYRPIARRWGRNAALAAAFLFSGLMHELVISVPAGGGWGLPTLYFALHGALVALERAGRLRTGRALTLACVIGPAPLLFHLPFVENVVLPMVMP